MPSINRSTNKPLEIIINEYDLPDGRLLREDRAEFCLLPWVPAFTCVVLGQSNKVEEALHVENILNDHIPVYKRPSGGEAVVLSSHMIVVSILERKDTARTPRFYFETYNEKIIKALHGLGVRELRAEGTSDICIRDKKILGSSIYRNKDLVFYHAVLNISESSSLMERYLKHPRREPGYRRGRTHGEFVTSLAGEGYILTLAEIPRAFLAVF
jgi:lipoate-protein ligase A